jgi:hypothetical protein
VFVAFLASSPSNPLAQFSPGTITAFADATGSSCTLLDDSEKLFDIYIVIAVAPKFGLAGSRFRIVTSAGFSATYVGEVVNYPHSGDVQGGVTIAHGTCLPGTFLLATVTYLGHGTSAPCSSIDVIGHPDSYYAPSIDVMDCHFAWLAASTLGSLLVNPVESQCAPWCSTVATERRTWGGIKALYR